MSDKYPRKVRITAYLTTGEAVEGLPITFTDEISEAKWGQALRKPKELDYLGLTQSGALGGTDSIYINPTYITHIRITDIQE